MKTATGIVILTLWTGFASGQKLRRDLPQFAGAAVTLTEPATDEAGFPNGPATVCVELRPQTQCYTPPKEFGLLPEVSVIQVDQKTPALFFKVASGGVSGWTVHFALLVPGASRILDNLFGQDPSVSNQSQSAFWNTPSISHSQIFVTADYVWGPYEGHYGAHRYVVSSFVRQPSDSGLAYYREDQYMTIGKYDLDKNTDILAAEKLEILARLRRISRERSKTQLGH